VTAPDDVQSLADVPDDAWPVLEQLARGLHLKGAELQPTLDAIVGRAVEIVAVAEHAGLILVLGGELVPQSTLGDPPRELDELQRRTGSGPCIDAAVRQTVIAVEDTAADDRWPEFAAAATSLGVASVLCAPLWLNNRRIGTLSLFAPKPYAFGDTELHLTELFATHAALALAEAQGREQWNAALASRDVIGQAKGILIERYRLTPLEAFDRLSRASQAANVRLVEVAQHLVETGEVLTTASP
jgi:GAF domain-containing protein